MASKRADLGFVWWNVQDFAHFDPTKVGADRWPISPPEYDAKRQRVETVLSRLCQPQPPQVIGFAEITDKAAHAIRDNLFPTYLVHPLASLYRDPDFHLGIIYDPEAGFKEADFLAVSYMPDTARPMATLDYVSPRERIRFYFCHWTARFRPDSEKWRQLAAQGLGGAVYDFLHSSSHPTERRHAVIVGDLNEEPFGILDDWLHTSRDRSRARSREHYTDRPIRRVRLYNCTWRLLGERFPHQGATAERETAGTYYWREERTWHSFDQVIVSGGLLRSTPPLLDEMSLRVACGRAEIPENLFHSDGLPCKFAWENGKPIGLSDHLPICGSIRLA